MAFECAVNSALSGTGATKDIAHNLPSATPVAAIIFATTNTALDTFQNRDLELLVGVTDFTTDMSCNVSELDAADPTQVVTSRFSTSQRIYDISAGGAFMQATLSVVTTNIRYTFATSPAYSAPLMQLVFGGCSAKTVTFDADSTKTATQTQSVTGVGFEPKFLFFIGSPRYDASGGTSATLTARWSFGFASIPRSIKNAAVSFFSADNVGNTDCGRQHSNTACIAFPNSTNSGVDGSFKVTAVGADGFTIEIIDQFSANVTIQVLALGGADFDCEAVDHQAGGTNTTEAVSFTNIDPIGALLLSIGSGGAFDTYQTDRQRLACGFVSETGPAQAGLASHQQDNLAAADTSSMAFGATLTSFGMIAASTSNDVALSASSPFAGQDIDLTFSSMSFSPRMMLCGFAQTAATGWGQLLGQRRNRLVA